MRWTDCLLIVPAASMVIACGPHAQLSAPAAEAARRSAAIGGYYRGVEKDERVSAFATYPEGLQSRLGLCMRDGAVVNCVAPAVSAQPTTPIAPER